MRSHEFDDKPNAVRYFGKRPDVVGKIDLGDYTLFLDEHLYDQAQERSVNKRMLQHLIAKIPQAKAKIKTLDAGQHFWLFDNTNTIALGVQVWHVMHKIYMVRTVWPGTPTDGRYPIFNVA